MAIRLWGHLGVAVYGVVAFLVLREKARLPEPYNYDYLFVAVSGFVIGLAVIINSVALEMNLRREYGWGALKKSFLFANAAAALLAIAIVALITYAL